MIFPAELDGHIFKTEFSYDNNNESFGYDTDNASIKYDTLNEKDSVQTDQNIESHKHILKSESSIEENLMQNDNIRHEPKKLSTKKSILPQKKSNRINKKVQSNNLIKESEPPIQETFSTNSDIASDSDNVPLKKKLQHEKKGKVERKSYHPYKLDKTALTCELCKETFTAHNLLLTHMGVHYPNYVCDTCGKPFVSKSNFKVHVTSHTGIKIPCTVCHKEMKPSSMSFHMKTHLGKSDTKVIQRYPCSHCSERFTSFCTRQRHLIDVHNVDVCKHRCNMCPKKFYLANYLKVHISRDHNKEKKVFCSVCNMGFYDNHLLKNHMPKHTGERKYICHVCPKKYTSRHALNTHLKSHADVVEKYICSYCDKGFTQKCSLRIHINKTHGKLVAPPT